MSQANDDDPELPPEAVPPIDFTTFILSLSASVEVHLGEVPHPADGEAHVELPLARQTIDLLVLLEEKTQGNLTGEEERLLSQILTDLKLRYLKKLNAAK